MRSFRALLTLFAVSAGISGDTRSKEQFRLKKNYRAVGAIDLPSGCLYEGRWFTSGSIVNTKETCLRCVCNRGALACTRRACSRLPDPPPKGCHILHRKGSCCPELHCPDGVTVLEQSPSARFENEDVDTSPASLTNVFPACVEGGTIYAAGSAMSSSIACEQCFCLGGTRRCVRPQCMPTPDGCTARPAAGACCPLRYYCERTSTKPPEERHQYDCEVNGKWIMEGERVNAIEKSNCNQCFCLQGEVQCQPLACAQPLMGCQPLLRPGDCCPHRYHCNHRQGSKTSALQASLHMQSEPTLKTNQDGFRQNKPRTVSTVKNAFRSEQTPLTSAFNNQLITTTKVKRKVNELPPANDSDNSETGKVTPKTITNEPKTNIKLGTKSTTKVKTTTVEVTPIITTIEDELTTEGTERTTEQPEGTMRIMINGTINCTAELSSTSIPLNAILTDSERITMEAQPRVPLIDTSDLGVTFSPNDLITEGTVNGFDENETFSINVTSSLRTNTSVSTKKPVVTIPVSKVEATALNEALNSSKKTKGDYDYDYVEPTLPPSLPNLKIIPFVAADAVVEDEPPKADMTYPTLDRDDKFPVYYPTPESKTPVYPTRREGLYNPTQYPVFVSEKVSPSYPVIGPNDMSSYSNPIDHEFPSSFGGRVSDANRVMKATTSAFHLETPAVNMFSPPQETEGGFVPKDPSVIDDYFSLFPSTPPSSVLSVPHLTTSMQLDVHKGDCTSSEGRRVAEGNTILVACSECRCLWGELQCTPRVCPTPARCTTALSQDPCCKPLLCDQGNETTQHTTTTDKISSTEQAKTSTEPLRTNLPPKIVIEKNTTEFTSNKQSNNDEDNRKVTNSTNKVVMTTSKPSSTTTMKPTMTHVNDDEDEEEEFSFGSVLKLLLSEYETTTVAAKTKPVARPTRKPLPTIAPFIPLPSYSSPKVSINRIDHLILGEASAITSTQSTTKLTTTTALPTRPTTRSTIKVVKDRPNKDIYSANEVTKTTSSLGVPGILKLAGCNIYGRMYRVGRIITELSTPCQECWCTELGVQCKPLKC